MRKLISLLLIFPLFSYIYGIYKMFLIMSYYYFALCVYYTQKVLGGLLGHAFCTGLAVIGGRMLAARISEKTVAVIGGLSFLFFALTSFLFGPDADF